LHQRLLEPPQQPVDVSQLRIVADGIRLVHVEQVDEGKNGLAAIGRQPLARRAQHQCSIASILPHRRTVRGSAEEHRAGHGRQRLEVERAVIEVEALVEPHLPFQKDAADKRRRAVPVRPQHGSQSNCPLRNDFGILFHLVLERISRSKERRMGGKSQRDLAIGLGKQCPPFRERIHIGSADPRIPIAAQVVGAERVDRYNDDGVRLRPSARGEEQN
jgi:hypothetical protein